MPLTERQADVLLGKPDRIVAIPDLLPILQTQPGYSPVLAEEAMDRVYRGFLWSQQQRGQLSPSAPAGPMSWRKDDLFQKCRAWIYRWDSPDDIIIGGLLPEKTGIIASAYLLVCDGIVADVGSLLRSKTKPSD
ncbi:MAG: hypothetical protein WCK05_04510 [Planctomycetota bacterium]